ncbi:hypothetical protein M569_10979, partial [Genlisea aurea]
MVQLKKMLSAGRSVVEVPAIGVSVDMPEPDVCVVTSDGVRIPMHSKILASASPVLEEIIEMVQNRRNRKPDIPILGVPYGAVCAFLAFLYSAKCRDDQMEMYGVHLLALSHVYSVSHLKQRCTRGLSDRLSTENVVDMIQLARLCSAPDLHIKCMKLLSTNFKAVEETEGWKFLQDNDPYLELEILQFMDEDES